MAVRTILQAGRLALPAELRMSSAIGVIDHASKDVLARFGRFGRVGRQAGEFTAVHNIAVNRQGNILPRRGGDR